MQRIIFFIADELATPSEIETINKLNSLTALSYSVHVRNSKIPNMHGSLEEGDRVAGSIPDEYKNNIKIDPNSLPVTLSSGEVIPVYIADGSLFENVALSLKDGTVKASLPPKTTLVKDGSVVSVSNAAGEVSGSHNVSVGNGKITSVKLDSLIATVKQNDSLNLLTASGATLIQNLPVSVSSGKLVSTVLPAINALVKTSDSLTVQDSNGASAGNGSATVSNNAVTSIKLDSSRAVINPGNTIPVQNSAGSAVENASVSINAGKATIKLSATIAPVKNGSVISLPVVVSSLLAVGTTTKSVTIRVENGVITGITI